jgi:glycosyltransferase 2 family protein
LHEKRLMPRSRLLTPLLWLLALVLAAWTFTQLPLAEISGSVSTLSFAQSGFWLGLNLAIIALCNYRWQILNHLFGLHPGFGNLLLMRLGGQAVSFITPGPHFGGEPLQVYWLHRLCKLPLGKSMLALGIDRFFELWVNFSILLLGIVTILLYSSQELPEGWALAGGLFLLTSMLLLLPWLVLRQPRWLANNLQKLAHRWMKHPRLMSIETGLQTMGDHFRTAIRTGKPALIKALGLSLFNWALLLLELNIVFGFVGVHPDLPGFFLILVSMRLAMLLPLPGGIGTIEAALLWSLQSLGFPPGAALGAIALMRLRDAIVLGTGLLCLRLLQLRQRAVSESNNSPALADVAQTG